MKKTYFLFFVLSIIALAAYNTGFAQKNLIPYPIHTEWQEDYLDLSKGIKLANANTDLQTEYEWVETLLSEWDIPLSKGGFLRKVPEIELALDPNLLEESYTLQIKKEGIKILGGSATAVFYGVQTLRQMEVKNQQIQTAYIEDEPAFPWRGFLVDVGRNYQPVDMLKEQIDIMARYKFNVLHFHFTEDIVWRLASKKYPGLTDASNMSRWEGKFYTEEDLKDLIAYSQERHIQLVPEIDMPGHSAAFTKYLGHDMQSDSGMYYIKELLKEFSETYEDLPYLHIGGDEVKITNQNFMPEITQFVEDLGYKTIGWSPGSNLEPQTIHQLWMGGPEKVKEEGTVKYIDSKHLYINHMDPLETVVTLFHRKIGNQNRAHNNLLGATLCAWPDRAVAKPEDMFTQNAVYPSMLSFAERAWQGGGREEWVANILPENVPDYGQFVDFEKRLLNHKKRYFSNLPFPYAQQSGKTWKLFGPYPNEGELSRDFDIRPESAAPTVEAEGGTLILRHWWADIIKGIIPNPEPNTTWYAYREIESDSDTVKNFWIGFDNFSRSYATDSPQTGTWDNRDSKVFVNGEEILPPGWQQAGQTGDLEVPMIDEGYSFRAPAPIPLKKGINKIWIKLPVGSFSGRSWENPVKWMFTFLEIE